MKKTLLTIGLAAVLTACGATRYEASGWKGGYKDQPISANQWTVSFNGNSNIDGGTVRTYLRYRCAEVCLENGFDWYEVSNLEALPSPSQYGTKPAYTCRITCGHNPKPEGQDIYDARETKRLLEPEINR